ncbi:hypothetical protein Q0Z83_039010 [Actinoplanes sichuanensis]|uniref:Uncharacterized protein n=1 Tax=Actinoplanes sichuanensis TaxID=512349 RepID=A0ABW4AUF9_9ACTN|nr:hypothetical protein [Actinoplanes sichuanensis]BEL05710.1 hypothetical protein Q0Z83_039010 [Actinoplanes sichuanensis]
MIDHDMACGACGYALVAIHRDGGVVYEHPVTPAADHPTVPVPADRFDSVFRRCHLCSVHQPWWEYRTEAATVETIDDPVTIIERYSSRWHVCGECAHLIDTDDRPALTRRCTDVMNWAPDSPAALLLAGLHEAIILSREPGRTLITTGTWPALPLKPPALPRIRDRLAALLRGPTGLPHPLADPAVRHEIADGLDQGQFTWIDGEFTDLIEQVHTDLPATPVTERIVPSRVSLLTWANPVGPHRLAAASWTRHQHGWRIVAYRTIHADLPEHVLTALRHEVGRLIPVHVRDIPDDHTVTADDPLAPLAATWLVIAQQLTRDEPTPPEPGLGRSYRRARRPPPDIRIVRIKPAARRTTTVNTAGGRRPPEHRFWVSGHTRHQPYGPGRTLRRDIPIDPYLKGPDGAPIKASTTVRILGDHHH